MSSTKSRSAKELLVYAHRGASAYYPENTILAFQKALELGAKAIELDLILTNDAHYVVHHDFYISDEKQSRLDLRKMSRHDIETHLNQKRNTESRLPFLEQVLAALPQEPILNLELKIEYPHRYRENVRRLVAILEKAPNPRRFIVSSFHLDAMIYMQKISSLSIAYLFMAHKWGQFMSRRALLSRRRPDAVHLELGHPHLRHWLKELPVSVFTVNEFLKAQDLATQGVRGIFSDFPDLIDKGFL